MRQGFLKSGLSSGKTQWQVASVSYNLSSHMVKEKTCKKIGNKNRKVKWVRGERSKAEANEGRGSFGTELGIGTSTVDSVIIFCFFPFSLGYFLCAHLL